VRNLLTKTAIAAMTASIWVVGCGGNGDVNGISSGGAGGTGATGGTGLDASSGGTGGAGGGSGAGGSSDGGSCLAAGSACTSPQECCTASCNAGTCGDSRCVSDNDACTSSAQCCSGTCNAAGACAPLNPACRTTGNACSTHGDCCSKLCNNGFCSSGSFCAQNGDVCAVNTECCGGLCNKAAGAALGTCGMPSAPGGTGCTVAGIACGGVADGGTGGVPSCGGECCSRACAPHRSGLLICQPPSGCHPTGEICGTNADCCGGVGTPNATGVTCSKANPADPVGRCDNGQACRPAGAVCKLAISSCNAENNCCSGNVNQVPLACQQDLLGIPRCMIAAQPCDDAGSKAGQTCATSADCCGLPCVPNPNFTADAGAGVPPFVCGGECVGRGGTCTTGADCCPGLPCTLPPGSTRGVCGSPPPSTDGGGSPPDGSSIDGESPDAPPLPPIDGGPVCAEYGQSCTMMSDCCNNVPCTNGRCVFIIK
jgi:hypothetical protein